MKKDKNKFRNSSLSLLLATTTSMILVILLSFSPQGVCAQGSTGSSDKDIKFEEYINSKAGYKIRYPSDSEILEGDDVEVEEDDYESVEFSDKNGEWRFSVYFQDEFSSIEEEANAHKDHLKVLGHQIFDEKPLTVAGQTAVMYNTFWESEGNRVTYIMMQGNDAGYHFSISVPKNKADQYSSLLFTMLKSFELTNVSEKEANAPKSDIDEIDPTDVDALFNKANMLYRQEKFEEAIIWLDKALAIDPKNVDALNGKGVALDGLGKFEEAIIWYDKALAIDPNNNFSEWQKAGTLIQLDKK